MPEERWDDRRDKDGFGGVSNSEYGGGDEVLGIRAVSVCRVGELRKEVFYESLR